MFHIARCLLLIESLTLFPSVRAFAGQEARPPTPTTANLVVPARRSPPPSRVPATTAPTVTAEERRYAAREVQAKDLETFVGGARGIYIGSSALIAALLVVLILVLI
jgi:hypothetical protein